MTTEPPTVPYDGAPDGTGAVIEVKPPRLFDAANRAVVLGVSGVVVALAFEAIAVATAAASACT